MDKINAVGYRISGLYRSYKIKKCKSAKIFANNLQCYVGHPLMDANQLNQHIYDLIKSEIPFMAGRFGSTELLNMRSYKFGNLPGQKYTQKDYFDQLCDWAGFFPNDIKLLSAYSKEMEESCKEVDVLAVWFHSYEDYYIKNYMNPDLRIGYLLDFEPWSGEVHWSSALEGKKVLVIHPFIDTIKKQYARRQELFPGTDILPAFELKTLKAVQTIAGEKDDRFKTWFDALEWMYQEALKIDFDIAIVGCGAYGFPLAAKLKKAGKQAIHLAGATQLLFGIKGKRWEENDAFEYVRKFFNDAWVHPIENDKPKQASNVEGGCYW